MRHNISNVLCVIGAPLFESTLAPRRSIAFRNSAGTWSRAPGKQFGVLDRWRDRHTRPARWSDTLRIRPVRWRKWNRIRIDLARLADPIALHPTFYWVKYSAKSGNIKAAHTTDLATIPGAQMREIAAMMTSSNGYISRVTGRGTFTFSLIWARIDCWVNNQGWWFESPPRPSWRQCTDDVYFYDKWI